VACRIIEGGYEIASDSITVRGHTQTKGANTSHSKLVETNGIVIGAVGTCEESSLLQLYASTRKPSAATDLALLSWLSEFMQWKDKMAGEKAIKNNYFVGFEGRVFNAEGLFIEEVKTFEAIGAGMDFALAALHMGHSVSDAVKTACELSVFCEQPIKVITKITP
jgi:ATP-dependent protease HslVU (ClpYQ) peptidase subunit